MKIKNISACVSRANAVVTPTLTGEYKTWCNCWEHLGTVSELKGAPLALEIQVGKAILGKKKDKVYFGAIVFTKDWPASRQEGEQWLAPKREENGEGAKYSVEVKWNGRYTNAATNHICVVEVMGNGFRTHEFCVASDGNNVFLVYNLTYHGRFFQRNNKLFVPDLERKAVTSGMMLDAIRKRVDWKDLPVYDGTYKCWAEQIDYKQLGGDEAIVVSMATPIGSFYLRDKKGGHVTSSINRVEVSAGTCVFPTVGMVCHGVAKLNDQRLVMDHIVFYLPHGSEEKYGTMMLSAGQGAVLPDMGVPEEDNIARPRRGHRSAVRRQQMMDLPPIDPGVLELGRLAFGGK